MMLASHELARIFFAGESEEARIVAADALMIARAWAPRRSPSACSMACIGGIAN